MICPNCGHENVTPGKFCASCGKPLPEAAPLPTAVVTAAVPPPPAEAAAKAPAKAPAVEAAAVEAAPPPAEPVEPAPAPAPVAAPPPAPAAAPVAAVAAPPAVRAAAPVAAVAAPPAVRATPGGGVPRGLKLGGVLTLLGGLAAIAAAFLPWLIVGDDLMKMDNWKKLVDYGSWDPGTLTHPNGDYLAVAGAAAAVCGLLLALGLARALSFRFLVTLVAVAAGVVVLAFMYETYGAASDSLSLAGSNPLSPLTTMGFAIYVGAAGGLAVILGSLIALATRE
jgi:hypothetical protein